MDRQSKTFATPLIKDTESLKRADSERLAMFCVACTACNNFIDTVAANIAFIVLHWNTGMTIDYKHYGWPLSVYAMQKLPVGFSVQEQCLLLGSY